jgi:CRP/FNR family transcriptional regulator
MNQGQGANCLICKSKSDCFKKLTVNELKNADKGKVEIKFKKKEIIAKQGVFASHVMYIKEGLVKQYIEGSSGHKDVIINFFPAGQVIGLSSLFGKSTFDFSVAAVEDSTLCLIDINIIRDLISNNGDFSTMLIRKMNETTIYAYRQLYDLTNRQLNGRLAGALLYLAKTVFKQRKFTMSLSRKDLANFTGMSTMSAIRVLNDFKSEGIINDKNGIVEILNIEALEQISKTG